MERLIRRLMVGGIVDGVLHPIGYLYVTGPEDGEETLLVVRLYPAILKA